MEETNASPKKALPLNDHNNKGRADKAISKIKILGMLKLILFKSKKNPKKNKAKKIEKSLLAVVQGK